MPKPEAKKAPATPKLINKARPSSTIRIPKPGEVIEDSPEEVKEEDVVYGASAYVKDDLLKAWESFAASKKAEGKDSEYNALQQPIELVEDCVEIILLNKLQEDIINKLRTDLMHHIRKSLNNGDIKLSTKIKEQEKTRMLYTNREKFEYLQELKPALKTLRERLGLDPEF